MRLLLNVLIATKARKHKVSPNIVIRQSKFCGFWRLGVLVAFLYFVFSVKN
jgi:hypothetical protein